MGKAQKYQESAEQFWRAKREKLGLSPIPESKTMIQPKETSDTAKITLREAHCAPKEKEEESSAEIVEKAVKKPQMPVEETSLAKAVKEPQMSAEETSLAEDAKGESFENSMSQNKDEPQIKLFVLPDLDAVQPYPEKTSEPEKPDYSRLSFEELIKVYNKDTKNSEERRDTNSGNSIGKKIWPFGKKEK